MMTRHILDSDYHCIVPIPYNSAHFLYLQIHILGALLTSYGFLKSKIGRLTKRQ